MGVVLIKKNKLNWFIGIKEKQLIIKSPNRGFRFNINFYDTINKLGDKLSILFIPSKLHTNSVKANIQKSVENMRNGYFRILKCEGVGLRFLRYKGIPKLLTLRLGMAHPLHMNIPRNISFRTQKHRILLYGSQLHELVTLVNRILYYRPVDPYKARGFKLSTDPLKLKPGKQKQR